VQRVELGQGGPILAYANSGYGWGLSALPYEALWQRNTKARSTICSVTGTSERRRPKKTIGTGTMAVYWPGVKGMWTHLAGD